MGKESYLIDNLMEWATFKDHSWGKFVIDEIKILEETRELYFKNCEDLDEARADAEQLRAYINVLERQLSLAQKFIEQRQKVRFPIYTKKRGGAKEWLKKGCSPRR